MIFWGAGELAVHVYGKMNPVSAWAVTHSAARHAHLRDLGLQPVVFHDARTLPRAAQILFAVPPTDPKAYLASLDLALLHWSGEGSFVLISSTGVYSEHGGGRVNEHSARVSDAESVRAEDRVLAAGGTVVRSAGLYSATKGPHHFYLKKGRATGHPDAWINLVHLDDVAELVAEVFARNLRKATLLACDDVPMHRRDLVALTLRWNEAQQNYPDRSTIELDEAADSHDLGKRCDGAETRRKLNWTPLYRSLEEFLFQV